MCRKMGILTVVTVCVALILRIFWLNIDVFPNFNTYVLLLIFAVLLIIASYNKKDLTKHSLRFIGLICLISIFLKYDKEEPSYDIGVLSAELLVAGAALTGIIISTKYLMNKKSNCEKRKEINT